MAFASHSLFSAFPSPVFPSADAHYPVVGHGRKKVLVMRKILLTLLAGA
jgi:hypothetical protein